MNGPQFQPQKGESVMVTNETKEVPLSEEKRLRLKDILQEFLKGRPELNSQTQVNITAKDFAALYVAVVRTKLSNGEIISLEELKKFLSSNTNPVITIISEEQKTGIHVDHHGQHVRKVFRAPDPHRHNHPKPLPTRTPSGKDYAANQGEDF
jgi:hypothetical protein